MLALGGLGGCNSGLQYNVEPADIAKQAEANDGSTAWAYAKAKNSEGVGEFPKDSWKCNLFIYDMLQGAGISAPKKWNATNKCYWPITAKDWTDHVAGFTEESSIEPGYIVSNGSHVGIAVSKTRILAANKESVGGYKLSGTIQRYNG